MNNLLNTMIKKIILWIKAARPHTMGLSVAVILVGSGQIGFDNFHWDVLLWGLLSAMGFQLVSNFANDYGDFKKGTDTHRPENYRALSAGNLTEQQVKKAIIKLSVFSIVTTIMWVLSAPISIFGKWVMFGLGVASVIAAITYTMGKRPYGYYALGDVMVFLFFGLVGVIGSYYLQGGDLSYIPVWLLAIVFGGLSASVLHINNMRDREKDKENHKITIANMLGDKAIGYQLIVFAIIMLCMGWYAILDYTAIILFLLAGLSLLKLWNALQLANHSGQHNDYNRCLALTVKMTLALSIPTFIIGLLSS